METCIGNFFEERAQLHSAVMPRNQRFLTDAEIEELLRDLPGQVIDFCLEPPRAQSKIA